MLLPLGATTIALHLNPDQDFQKAITTEVKRLQREKADREKNEEMLRKGRETQTGLTVHG